MKQNLSLDEELQQDAEENQREVEYIQNHLSAELQDKYNSNDLYYMLDAIVEYFYSSGILESDNEYVDIDLQKVAEYICNKAKEENHTSQYEPDDVFFVVQADMDFQEENL